MAVLEVKNLKKNFGSTDVLKGVSFSLEQGQVLTIIGSSGSGKTTLLRCLNFLESPDEGEILVNSKVLTTGNDEELRQNRLHFGLVFQNRILWEQVKVLKHQTEMESVFPNLIFCQMRTGQNLSVYQDLAFIRRFQKVQTPQQRGFAAAGGTDDGQHLALLQRKADALQNIHRAEALC